jgi:hypothetical protein
MVKQKQAEDLADSFGDLTSSQWFFNKSQPTSKSGKSKGLTLVLDAHTDILETGTVSDDLQVTRRINYVFPFDMLLCKKDDSDDNSLRNILELLLSMSI